MKRSEIRGFVNTHITAKGVKDDATRKPQRCRHSSLARELVAFANSTGGKILLGVRDDGTVVGARDTNELRARIEDLARNCDPPVKVLAERVGKVVVLTVRESENKPVQCREGFFWRQGAATQKLSRDEIRDFFRSEGAIRFDLSICPKFRYPEDFDRKKFNEWLSLSRITRRGRTEDILVNIEAAERSGGRLVFRNAGVLFFAKNVRHFFPQAYVTCLLFRDPDRVHILDRKDFDGGIVSDIEESLRFVERNTRVAYKIEKLQRENITEYPMRAVREAITNAVMHRDYFEAGANVFVDIHPDRIEISSPGGLPKGLTLAELGKKSVRRNPLVADLLQRIEFIEKAGTGILRMTGEAKAHGSPPPSFTATTFFTAKEKDSAYTFHTLQEPRDKPVKKLKYRFVGGKIENLKDASGKTITYESTERQIDNVWRIRCLQPANLEEWVNYSTQKPVDLIQRILQVASNPGDLVLDAFCGSGGSLVASETLNRRWIGCDLSRFAIHVTRKRLLGIESCRPFEILNLGKYERQYWQGVTFGDKAITEQALYEYLAFILKLYGAQPVSGLIHLHGKKGRAMAHIGAVDAPVTIDEINSAVEECVKLKQPELHVLGWEWEMGLYDLMTVEAKKRGVELLLLQIPREVMEQQAVDKGDIRFFELAYLQVEIKTPKKLTATVTLKDFVIPNTELIPEEVRSKVKKWSDYIDYWAVDWDFQNDTFMQGWVTYRTRKDRTLARSSDPHTYEKAGKYRILVKVVDIFGNDTSEAYDVEV
jgi:predicted HTH transcriptional regulator